MTASTRRPPTSKRSRLRQAGAPPQLFRQPPDMPLRAPLREGGLHGQDENARRSHRRQTSDVKRKTKPDLRVSLFTIYVLRLTARVRRAHTPRERSPAGQTGGGSTSPRSRKSRAAAPRRAGGHGIRRAPVRTLRPPPG